MGVLRLNGKAYGGGIDVIELTQAQYNALPESKLSDDILYVISDSVNGADGYPPLIYSEEERETGVWVDGRPLYQKTINFGSLPASGSKTVQHNIQNLGYIVDIRGTAINPTNHGHLHIPHVHRSSISNQVQIGADNTSVTIFVATDQTQYSICYLTLQYVKTTDTKGSGKWTTQGTLACHYSTTEHIVGTWVDGKPVYEKTWIVPKSSLASGETAYTHGDDLHMDTLIDVSGALNGRPLVQYHSSSFWATSIYNIDNNAFWIYLGSNVYSNMGSTATVRVTLRYTKTTDQ